MKQTGNARNPLPELVLTDRKAGNAERTGLTVIDVRIREYAQRIDIAFIEGFTNALGVPPPDALTVALHRRNQKILEALFGDIEDELRDGYARIVTRQRQARQGYDADTIRAARELYVSEYHRRRAAFGREVTKSELYAVLKSNFGIGKTKAKEITHDIELTAPKPDDEQASDSERVA